VASGLRLVSLMLNRGHHCSVLVVDDDPEIREVLRVAIAADGYEVATVANGREALDHLRSTADTCMIVLDLMMPVMDAMRFRTAQLRDRSLAWIPTIVLSGSPEAGRETRRLGARSLVRKPLDLDQLREALRHVGCCRAFPRHEQRRATVSLTAHGRL
jgi:CheY-like chemotaxis protein